MTYLIHFKYSWAFFASYLYMKRGHLLPFHGIVKATPPDQIHQIKTEEKKVDADQNNDDDTMEPMLPKTSSTTNA